MTAKEWFEKAQAENLAIGAFNADNLDIFKAICVAAQRKKSPVMVEFSSGEVEYFGLANIVDLVKNAREEYQVPILLNLDHAKKVEDCMQAIDQSSFDLIHFDGSELEFSENISGCKKVIEAAHAKALPAGRQVLVEGEIDKIAGSSVVHNEDLDFELLGKIHQALPNTFLSLHGGSGIPADQVRHAIEVGKIVKVNVNTELRQEFRDALTEKLGESPSEYAMYKLMPDVILAVAAVVEAKIEVFRSTGKA